LSGVAALPKTASSVVAAVLREVAALPQDCQDRQDRQHRQHRQDRQTRLGGGVELQPGARRFPNDRVRSCRPGPETQRRKFVGTGCPGFVDDRRENAGPAAFWPSTGRGRVRTVASTCQDRRFGCGGGLREPPHPRTGLVPTTRGIRSRLAQASTGARASACRSFANPGAADVARQRNRADRD